MADNEPRMGPPVAPTIFTPHNMTLSDSIAKAIADELSRVPEDAVKVSVRFTDGHILTTTVATRVAFDNGWALGAGVYARKSKDRPVEVGIDGVLSWK